MANKAMKTRRKDDRLAVRLNAIRIFERAKVGRCRLPVS